MRLLYFGDVVGRSGRDALVEKLPGIRKSLDADFVVCCGENAAHGFGITPKLCADFYEAGVDCITLGNHSWDAKEIIPYIDGDPKLIRPQNYPPGTPGRGVGVYEARHGRKVMVIQRPCGTLVGSLWPRGAHPRKAAISVLVQVSSMKTRRSGSTRS